MHQLLNRLRFISACHCLLGIAIIFSIPLAIADKIYLKDGSVEESDRIWESENYVHFILKGTQSVEIRYVKEIVQRIERNDDPRSVRLMERKTPSISPKKPHNEAPKASTNDNVASLKLQPDNGKAASQKAKVNIDYQIVQRNREVAFYNPHREKRYWSDRNSGHATLSNAIESIARFYGRTPVWVEQHMGQENDLSVIHSNLIAAIEKEQSLAIEAEENHLQEKGLSKIDVNDVSTSAEDQPKLEVTSLPHDNQAFLSIPQDILFYDPRRPKKYWISMTSHHNTMDGAVRALAEFYSIPESWVEDHMGNTNQLYKIHESIQSSLKMLKGRD